MEKQKETKGANKKKTFCEAFFCTDNLLRDVIILAIAVGLSALLIINHRQISYRQGQSEQAVLPQNETLVEQAVLIENEAENPTIDTISWPMYSSSWYGFEVKYPENWNKPVLKGAVRGANWEYRYQFRKSKIEEGNQYAGFDVAVYNVNKVKELSGTDEFPTIKNEELKTQGFCQEIGGHLGENEEYPAEQVYIDQNDDCYYPAYFYTLTRDNYIYNIVPILAGEEEKTIQTEEEIIRNFPEFISASSTFNLIDIKRPKPVPVKPKINAPHPTAATKKDSQGRRVCAKKNDHPGKSKQGKKKHLDMECCLDPDEYPNPHCYYPPEKYGKYLK